MEGEKEKTIDYRTLMFQVHNESKVAMDIVMKSVGLAPAEAMILMHLSEHGGATIGEIVAECRLNQGNASTLCKRMEQNGLITRSRGSSDERVVRLDLTEAGKETISRLNAGIDEFKGYIDREAKRRGVELRDIWTLIREIFFEAVASYRRDRTKSDDTRQS